jgi:8-amino-7-oxononanoate synthase
MQRLSAEIEQLKATHNYRMLRPASGRDFTSNDYLGLASHKALREAAKAALDEYGVMGAGGSRLLRGNHPLHETLEASAAAFFGCEKTLYFGSGYLANLALFPALCGRHDAIVFDEFVHASMKEGIHAAPAERYRAKHNDLASFKDALRRAASNTRGVIWIAVESLYSMDGDLAPLVELAALARDYEAALIIDEAHATGVMGRTGRGCAEALPQQEIITVHTGGKALGVAGALVCGSSEVIDYLVNKARPFIYSTAPPPMIAAALTRALALVDEEPERREELHALAKAANEAIAAATGAEAHHSASQIIPVLLGGEEKALKVASALQEAGFDIRAIRPPTVPQGTSRLRISINASQTESEIAELGAALAQALKS